MKTTWLVKKLVEAYVREIVKLQGVTRTVIFDWDSKFLLHFWKELQEAFRTKLSLSTTFHPAADGQTESPIQSLERLVTIMCVEVWI